MIMNMLNGDGRVSVHMRRNVKFIINGRDNVYMYVNVTELEG